MTPYRKMLAHCRDRNTKMIQDYLREKKSPHEIHTEAGISRQRMYQIFDYFGITKRHSPRKRK